MENLRQNQTIWAKSIQKQVDFAQICVITGEIDGFCGRFRPKREKRKKAFGTFTKIL